MKFAVVACLLTCLGVGIGELARAADPLYLGNWKIFSAVAAPWADPKQKPDSTEPARLLGKIIVFRPREITGPPPFACKAPHYKQSNFAADMIFQGAFGEMQSNNKSVDPNQLARVARFCGQQHQDAGNRLRDRFSFRRYGDRGDRLQRHVYTLKKQ